MKKAKKKKVVKKPIRWGDVPFTASMLSKMEDRLNHRITSEIEGVKSEIEGVRSEVHGVKAEVHGLKSEIHGIKSDIHDLRSDVHGVKSELSRVAVLVEEQNARNKYVMDGYAQLYDMLSTRFGGGEQQV